MARNEVKLTFTGDDKQLQKTFDNVGSGAKDMARDVDRSSKDLAGGLGHASEGFDTLETRTIGFRDALTGASDLSKGFAEGNLLLMATGIGDLASSMVNLVIPAVKSMALVLKTNLASAMTFVSAHPLMVGVLVGGAIIVGLIALEAKFGLISKAVKGLGQVFTDIWPSIKSVINMILGGVESLANGLIDALTVPFTLLNKIPGVKKIVPDIPNLRLPRLHSGGTNTGGTEMLAIIQAGERVVPAGGGGGGGIVINVAGSVITERDLGRVVADALRNNRLIGISV